MYDNLIQLSDRPISEKDRYSLKDLSEIADTRVYDYLEASDCKEIQRWAECQGAHFDANKGCLLYPAGYREVACRMYMQTLQKEYETLSVDLLLEKGIPYTFREASSPFFEDLIVYDGDIIRLTDWKTCWVEPEKPYYVGSTFIGVY